MELSRWPEPLVPGETAAAQVAAVLGLWHYLGYYTNTPRCKTNHKPVYPR